MDVNLSIKGEMNVLGTEQSFFTGSKFSSCFNIKDETKFQHRYNVIYLRTCPETTFNNYIGEGKQRIFERVKDHYGRDLFKLVVILCLIKLFTQKDIFK